MSQLQPTTKRNFARVLLALVKPRIIELLLVTAIPVLVLATRGWPNWRSVVAVILFGTIAAAGANAWNSIIEKETDALMKRTQHRPLVTGEISVQTSVLVATSLSITSIVGMYWLSNVAAALLTAAAIGFYVLGYTLLLKPRTNQNIVWGGIAGCFPVIIAESIVLGEVTINGWLLFLLVFFWTPAHYWPLAAHFKEDYARAAIPMLPVEKPTRVVAAWTLFYTVLTVIHSFIVYFVIELGAIYLISATVTGCIFLLLSVRYFVQSSRGEKVSSMEVFHFSITYLAIVFIALAVDVLL